MVSNNQKDMGFIYLYQKKVILPFECNLGHLSVLKIAL